MISSGNPHDEQNAYSVGELLRIRKGDDPWDLALVQREEVWDVERMKRLLDSLLAGYPVGALLLCQSEEPSKVIDRSGDEEVVRDAKGAYQLLDGQQRLNALYTMLTTSDEKHRKGYGRFYFNLTVARQDPTPAGAGQRRGPAVPYIVWREGPDGPLGQGEYDQFGDRGRCLNLSCSTTGPRSRARWLMGRSCSSRGPRHSQRTSTRSSRMR